MSESTWRGYVRAHPWRAVEIAVGVAVLLLMTTSDEADPARRLYASDGWRVIGPGIGEETVIMGKRPRP